MNALERYFAETGENANKLAEKIGCAPSTLTRPLKGERNASMDLALDVERGTGGKVTGEDFLSICLAAKRGSRSEPAIGSEESEVEPTRHAADQQVSVNSSSLSTDGRATEDTSANLKTVAPDSLAAAIVKEREKPKRCVSTHGSSDFVVTEGQSR